MRFRIAKKIYKGRFVPLIKGSKSPVVKSNPSRWISAKNRTCKRHIRKIERITVSDKVLNFYRLGLLGINNKL
jgi:hypothetical protein